MKHLSKFDSRGIESLEFKFVVLLALLISDRYIILKKNSNTEG